MELNTLTNKISSAKRLLPIDNNTLTAGSASTVLVLRLAAAVGAVRVPTVGAAAIKLDAVASAGDAVTLAGTAGLGAREGAKGAAVATAGAKGLHIGGIVGV